MDEILGALDIENLGVLYDSEVETVVLLGDIEDITLIKQGLDQGYTEAMTEVFEDEEEFEEFMVEQQMDVAIMMGYPDAQLCRIPKNMRIRVKLLMSYIKEGTLLEDYAKMYLKTNGKVLKLF